jgi:PAS domain S-box-containing protein
MDLPAQDGEAVNDPAALYRLIADTIPHMVWTARADGGSDYYNRRYYEYTGLTARELVDWGWKEIVHPDEIERCLAAWSRALQTGERYDMEYRLRRADGTYRWHHGTALPLRDAAGRVWHWFGTCTEIEAEVRSAQILDAMVQERTRALRESEASVRGLMDRLVATQESERRRVAGELHDLIGQNLTALGIDLAALRQWMCGADATQAASGQAARLEAMRALLEQTIDQVRGVMGALQPPELEDYGLVAALRCNAEEFSRRTGMKASLQVTGHAARLDRDAELALFRIVQEAMVNAAKHSHGSALRIGIAQDPERIRVTVADDGAGITGADAARESGGGWGLRIMRERAAAFGGTLDVQSPGSGTRVVVELPADGKRRDAD